MLNDDINSTEDLSLAVKAALERKGVLKDIRAKIRAEVYHTLEDKTTTVSRPGIFNSTYSTSNGNIIFLYLALYILLLIIEKEYGTDLYLAQELIREYLVSLQHNNTLSVYCEETGQPREMGTDRTFIGGELGFNVSQSDSNVPLLVLLVQQLRKNKDKYEEELHGSLINEVDISDI